MHHILFLSISSMSTGTSYTPEQIMAKRWMFVQTTVERPGPLADPDFEAADTVKFFVSIHNMILNGFVLLLIG